MDREERTDLHWERDYVFFTWSGSDVIVYPIREDYHGRIRIRFSNRVDGGEHQTVYERVIDLWTREVVSDSE